jgi:hypothetical protein
MTTLLDTPTSKFLALGRLVGKHAHGRDPLSLPRLRPAYSATNEREVDLLRHGTHRDDELAAEQVLVKMIQRFRWM